MVEGAAELLDVLSSLLGVRVDGIIGNELLDRYVVEIDFAARTLTFHDPATYQYAGRGKSVGLVREGGLTFVRTLVTAKEGDAPIDCMLILDIGSGAGVSLKNRTTQRNGLLDRVPTVSGMNLGMGGTEEIRRGHVDRIQFRDVDLRNVPTEFLSSDRVPGDGLLGIAVLRKFNVVIDHSREQMFLERGADFDKDLPIDLSGMSIFAHGADFREFRVSSPWPGKPAAEAGLETDDVLLAIDGKPTREMTVQQVREKFTKNSTRMLKIQRGKQTLERRIVLRDVDAERNGTSGVSGGGR